MNSITNGTPQDQQFWVIGAAFRDTGFRSVDGAPRAEGPFTNYADALRTWRTRSEEARHEALTRYTIASNPMR